MSGVLNLVSIALYSKFTGDTTLKGLVASNTSFYAIKAPKDAAYPFVVWSLLYGGPENITPSDLQDHLYFIRAYATSALVAGNIHAQIVSLLHKQTLSVTGFTNIWSALEEEYEGEEILLTGNTVYMRGGGYRFRLDS
jgi:hypothetical protein